MHSHYPSASWSWTRYIVRLFGSEIFLHLTNVAIRAMHGLQVNKTIGRPVACYIAIEQFCKRNVQCSFHDFFITKIQHNLLNSDTYDWWNSALCLVKQFALYIFQEPFSCVLQLVGDQNLGGELPSMVIESSSLMPRLSVGKFLSLTFGSSFPLPAPLPDHGSLSPTNTPSLAYIGTWSLVPVLNLSKFGSNEVLIEALHFNIGRTMLGSVQMDLFMPSIFCIISRHLVIVIRAIRHTPRWGA